MQQQTGQSGHQTRRAVALQRAQSVATSGTAPASATTPTQQVQKVTLQRAVSVDGGEVRTLVEGQTPTGASLVQTPSGKTVNTLLLFVQYRLELHVDWLVYLFTGVRILLFNIKTCILCKFNRTYFKIFSG